MKTYVDQLIADQTQKIQQAQQDLVISKLKEKGFDPGSGFDWGRISMHVQEGWEGHTHYYIDHGKETEVRIVSISKVQLSTGEDGKINANFTHY